jgi:general secretion pathway protein N
MKKILSLGLVFISFFIAFLIYLAPAAIVFDAVKPQLPKHIKLAGISGTIWQGQVQQIQVNRQYLDSISWHLKPLSLMTGEISLDINFGKRRNFDLPYGKASVTVPMDFTNIQLTDSSLRVPANMAMSYAQLPMSLPAKGNLKLELADASLLLNDATKLCDRLSGEIDTHNLSVQGLQGWIDFDTISGKLKCNRGALSLAITETNQLGLQLEADLTKRGVEGSGFVKPDSTMPKQVHDAVKFLGQPDNLGRYKLPL